MDYPSRGDNYEIKIAYKDRNGMDRETYAVGGSHTFAMTDSSSLSGARVVCTKDDTGKLNVKLVLDASDSKT